jgi:putative transposase
MKRSKFTDEQILAIVKEGEAGRKVCDLSRAYGITEQTITAGRPSMAAWS